MGYIYFKIGIPDTEAERLGQALLSQFKYEATLKNPITGEEEANPVDPVTFQLNIFEKIIKEHMKAHEVPDLAKADREARIAEIDAIEFSITVE